MSRLDKSELRLFWYFIRERYKVFIHKSDGDPKPWTKDPILQTYRFCNVYREDDKVTTWIAENWREPYSELRPLWFAMVVARFVNFIPTLHQLGFVIPWDAKKFKFVLEDRKKRGLQVFTGAYMIHSRGSSKIKYLADKVFTPLWDDREHLNPVHGQSLISFYENLMTFNGIGSFMAGQIIADIKYVKPLLKAPDWFSFAVPGPGSKKGLNILYGADPKRHWSDEDWKDSLDRLHEIITTRIQKVHMPPLHAQDLQNCLCEFSKYRRGYCRSLYSGQAETDLLFKE